jgi:putative hydrolase of the HAD superfamily
VFTPRQNLQHIDTWLFDLDNTLYPSTCNLQQQMSAQARRLYYEVLGLSIDQARELQSTYMREYGTSLRGLIENHGVEPDLYFQYIHDVDYLVVEANPALNLVLSKLSGRKFVFTNGTSDHAERVLDRLGCAAQFEAVFDIVGADYAAKPDAAPYHRVAHIVGGELASIALVDDVPNNLRPAAALEMATVG